MGRFAVVLIVPLASALALTISRCGQSEFESPIKPRCRDATAIRVSRAGGTDAGCRNRRPHFNVSPGPGRLAARVGDINYGCARPERCTARKSPVECHPAERRLRLAGRRRGEFSDVNRRAQYHPVFNRDPWIEFSREHDAAASVAWRRVGRDACRIQLALEGCGRRTGSASA